MPYVPAPQRFTRGGRWAAAVFVVALLVGSVMPGGSTPAVAAATSPLVAVVSTTTPYDYESVTVTVSGLPADDYDVGYLVSLGELFFPFDAANDVMMDVLATNITVDGTGSLAASIPWQILEFTLYPGVIVVYPKGKFDTNPPTKFGDFSAVSEQMFPGRGKNGSPSYEIEGDGFVDGAFVAGEAISVTATGFPEGTLGVLGVAWFPTEPSTGDVDLDFWRDYLNCLYGDDEDYSCPILGFPPEAGFILEPDEDDAESLAGDGTAPSAGMSIWVYHAGESTVVPGGSFFGYGVLTLTEFLRDVEGAIQEGQEERGTESAVALSCVPAAPAVGRLVTCTVTGGDPDIDILWRAAYNRVFAEAGVTLDETGAGEFSFVVPAAALGEDVTVELVEWLAPVSIGIPGGPVPTSVPSGGGPVPVWSLVLLALAGGLVLRRMSAVGVRG